MCRNNSVIEGIFQEIIIKGYFGRGNLYGFSFGIPYLIPLKIIIEDNRKNRDMKILSVPELLHAW